MATAVRGLQQHYCCLISKQHCDPSSPRFFNAFFEDFTRNYHMMHTEEGGRRWVFEISDV